MLPVYETKNKAIAGEMVPHSILHSPCAEANQGGSLSCIRTKATNDHEKAHSYFHEDAAICMRNDCNRAAKENHAATADQWHVMKCEPCSKATVKETWHVVSQVSGYLCL